MKKENPNIRHLVEQAFKGLSEKRFGDAEDVLTQALALAPRHAATHTLLAKALFGLGRIGESERHAREAIRLDPKRPESYETLARVLENSDRLEFGLEEFRRAAEADPGGFGANYGFGLLLMMLGRNGDALNAFRRCPETPAVATKIARTQCRLGQYMETLQTINGLIGRGIDVSHLRGLAGQALFGLKSFESAGEAFGKALERAPRNIELRAGLAASYGRSGRPEEAHRISMEIIAEKPPLTRAATAPRAVVLVLWELGLGYFPKPRSHLAGHTGGNAISQIAAERFTFHYLCIDHPDPVATARALGPIDVIYNNVANAESGEATGGHERVRRILDTLGLPVINAPEAVARTTRSRNAETLPRAADIVFPNTRRYCLVEGALSGVKEAIVQAHSFPLLLRRTATNHDTNIEFVASEADLGEALQKFQAQSVDAVYAIDYIAEEYRPGVYRKIRCALIEGRLYPAHMDFSTNWNVHRTKDDMVENELMKASQYLMDQEHAYLRDPEDWLGAKNVRRLEDIGRAIGLDYVGVDFNIMSSGELVVFETNPAMNCIEKRKLPDFPYFADYWERNLLAFEQMFLNKAGKA